MCQKNFQDFDKENCIFRCLKVMFWVQSTPELAAVLFFPLIFLLIFLYLVFEQISEISTYEIFGQLTNCTFKPSSNSSSTEKDAIFTYSFSYNNRLQTLIRSIRSTGCKAIIYIFTPHKTHIPISLIGSNVKQVLTSPLTTSIISSQEKSLWEWYYSFLISEGVSFNRIIHTSPTDSIFFGDPFSKISSTDELYVQIDENQELMDKSNIEIINSCHLNSNISIENNKVASPSFLGGGQKAFTKFVEKLITHNEWHTCWYNGAITGDFNYVLWQNINKFDFKTVLLNCSSGFVIADSCIDEKRMMNERGQFVSRRSDKPIVYASNIHQSHKFMHEISKQCPLNENVKFS